MLRWAIQSAVREDVPSNRGPQPRARRPSAARSIDVASNYHLANPAFSLPGPVSVSHQQASFRAALVSAANECISHSKADSSVRLYNSILDRIIPAAEAASGIKILPCDSDEQFIALFSHHLVSNSSGPGPVNAIGDRSVRWSSVRTLRAALSAWHASRGIGSALDAWTPRMLAFWAGLKRKAVHSVTNKAPLGLEDVRELLHAGASAWAQCKSFPPGTHFSDLKPLLLDLRSAASVALAFFGIRRAAEVSDTLLQHISPQKDSGSLVVHVPRQKNDQLGRGQAAVIPPFPAWGLACPTKIILAWTDARALIKSSWDSEGRIFDLSNNRPNETWLFISLSGPSWGGRFSPDAFREALRKRCLPGGPCPSPRKGGVRFFRSMGVPKDVVQVQGGWKSQAVMSNIYDGYDHYETSSHICLAAMCASKLDSATAVLQLWAGLSSEPPNKSPLISRLHSASSDFTPSLAHSFGPAARAGIVAALKSWNLADDARKMLSYVVVRLRCLERDHLRLNSLSRPAIDLARDNAAAKRSRSPSPGSASDDSALE